MKTQIPKYETYQSPTWWRRYVIEIITIIGGLFAINLIFLAHAYRDNNTVDPVTAGQLGDFVGGYIGTGFALVSVVLLYSTLKNQRNASMVEEFQNKYFELIKMHRDNVAETSIGKDFGKKIFVLLIREFREILAIARNISQQYNQNFTHEQLFIISYYVLFFGVGPNSSRMLKEALKSYDKSFVNTLEETLNNESTKKAIKSQRQFKFTPFEGHQSRLGHYYRHLYQTVCYVDKQKLDIDKYDYVKTIRAQLTTHEQALLFINCLTPIGKIWWEKELITRYRIVRNVPCCFFESETEIDLASYFPNDYFEYQERTETSVGDTTQPT